MPKEVVEEVRQRADGNVSRWITEAVERQIDREVRHERLGQWLDEMMKDQEPFTEEELERARAEWPDA